MGRNKFSVSLYKEYKIPRHRTIYTRPNPSRISRKSRRIKVMEYQKGKIMIESNKTYYECEYCGKVSQDYEEIKECEKNCKSISLEVEKIIESCNKLNKLGCTVELREFPYYEHNKLDLAFARRISKEYKLVFKENGNVKIQLCGIPERKEK